MNSLSSPRSVLGCSALPSHVVIDAATRTSDVSVWFAPRYQSMSIYNAERLQKCTYLSECVFLHLRGRHASPCLGTFQKLADCLRSKIVYSRKFIGNMHKACMSNFNLQQCPAFLPQAVRGFQCEEDLHQAIVTTAPHRLQPQTCHDIRPRLDQVRSLRNMPRSFRAHRNRSRLWDRSCAHLPFRHNSFIEQMLCRRGCAFTTDRQIEIGLNGARTPDIRRCLHTIEKHARVLRVHQRYVCAVAGRRLQIEVLS